jgi:hypothetical protein
MALAGIEGPLFISMTNKEMYMVKSLFNLASSVLWATSGRLLRGEKPDYSLFFGMIESIMKAQPLSSTDVGPDVIDCIRSVKPIPQYGKRLHRSHDCNSEN